MRNSPTDAAAPSVEPERPDSEADPVLLWKYIYELEARNGDRQKWYDKAIELRAALTAAETRNKELEAERDIERADTLKVLEQRNVAQEESRALRSQCDAMRAVVKIGQALSREAVSVMNDQPRKYWLGAAISEFDAAAGAALSSLLPDPFFDADRAREAGKRFASIKPQEEK